MPFLPGTVLLHRLGKYDIQWKASLKLTDHLWELISQELATGMVHAKAKEKIGRLYIYFQHTKLPYTEGEILSARSAGASLLCQPKQVINVT